MAAVSNQAVAAPWSRRQRRLAERSLPLLPPRTEIRQVIWGQRLRDRFGIPFGHVGGLTFGWQRYWIIAVTAPTVYLLECGMWSPHKPKRVYGAFPRSTPLQTHGSMWGFSWRVSVGDEVIWVSSPYFDQVTAADAELTAATAAGRPLG